MTERRVKNTGGISEVGPGHFRVRWRDVGGHQRERTVRGSRSDAERVLRAELATVDRGEASADRELTVADWLESYLALVRPGLAPRSLTRYEQTIHRVLVPALGRRRLVGLTEHHVADAMEAWARAGVSPAAVIWRVNLLRMALGRAVKSRKLTVNVATFVDLPEHRRRLPEPPSDTVVDAILEATRDHPYGLAYAIAIGTGMRLGEIRALRWTDVDFAAGEISVRLSMTYGTEDLKVTKSEAGDRVFPMPTWLATRLAEKRDLPGTFVVATRYKRAIDGKNINRVLHRTCDELGVRRTNLRQIRHYAATRMLQRGVDMAIVSRAMGHSTIAMTVDTYGHIKPDRRIAEAMER